MKYLVCNFKNKLLKVDVTKYNNRIGEINTKKTKLVICPSFVHLSYFDMLGYSLGVQDISSFGDEAITGEVKASQAADMGASYAIIGHSERREYRREINIEFINKINQAIHNNLKVIYCIGETLKDRENGDAFIVLEKQISEVLNNVEIKNIMIAYEPVWAIGTGIIPDKKDIEETVGFIKKTIRSKYDIKIDVLYGGSVNPENISILNSIGNVDGFLVGGASLNPESVKELLLEMEK